MEPTVRFATWMLTILDVFVTGPVAADDTDDTIAAQADRAVHTGGPKYGRHDGMPHRPYIAYYKWMNEVYQRVLRSGIRNRATDPRGPEASACFPRSAACGRQWTVACGSWIDGKPGLRL